MIKERRQLVAPYDAVFLFDIAQDVENYKHFLPHCVGARICDKSAPLWKVQNVYRWGPASHKFLTYADVRPNSYLHITSDPKDRIKLDVLWEFKELGNNQTEVIFETGFESTIPILEKLVHAMLGEIANRTERAFLKRAEELKLKADRRV